ncbi:hypothetical protein DA792_11175 [Celeribacter baekdonensis]|uniref:Uncharacterized protein n=2 Tax=Celeribacter baekdonensis TaxID=875171 RepID=A0A2R4M384_9RHOB|nr:hypothetical protein DA792_11175 [Celeribacter baekdonensis]|tara:strand:+ start:9544 stop:9873 length:330 start_codon:yes stop_codon:yes gene_type:complete
MFMTRSPADELASLRAKIAELRARETALEARFIEMNDTGRFVGFSYDVVVSRTAYQVFDISKLPDSILNDDRFYATKHVTSIRVEPRDETDAFMLPQHAGEEFDVIEHH